MNITSTPRRRTGDTLALAAVGVALVIGVLCFVSGVTDLVGALGNLTQALKAVAAVKNL